MRLVAQISLTSWAIAEIAMLAYTHGSLMPVVGHRWGAVALACFAGWMFLSSLTIQNTALFPRSSVVGAFALLEMGTAVGAWGWFWANVRARFKITVSW